jgi:hypothetical protein
MDTACRTPFFFLQKIIFFLKKHLTNEKASATIFTSYHSNRRLSGNQYPFFAFQRAAAWCKAVTQGSVNSFRKPWAEDIVA